MYPMSKPGWDAERRDAQAMADTKHLDILWRGVETWNSWRADNSVVVPEFSGADLRRIKLKGVNLMGAKLGGTDLRRAVLDRATMGRADLFWADLSWANLVEPDLRNANISMANMFASNLFGADLSGADLCDYLIDRGIEPAPECLHQEAVVCPGCTDHGLRLS